MKKKKDSQNFSKKERTDYKSHHTLIQIEFLKMIKETGQIPTQEELAKQTGLSRRTIETHFQNMNFDKLLPQYKHITPLVIASLANTAIKTGKAPEAKLFCQLVEGFSEKTSNVNLDFDMSKIISDPNAEYWLKRIVSEDPQKVFLEFENSKNIKQ